MRLKGGRRSRRYVAGRCLFSSHTCSYVLWGKLCNVQQIGHKEGGLREISEIEYSRKIVDMYIYEYINNRVHNKWNQSRGIFQTT